MAITIFLLCLVQNSIWCECVKNRKNGIDAQHAYDDARNVVDGEHVARTETTAEEADYGGKYKPPQQRSAEESDDDDCTSQQRVDGDVGVFVHSAYAEHGEEGEKVGNDDHEIGDGEAEHRGEILPHGGLAGTVATDLRYGILEEDIDSHDNHEHTADNTQEKAVFVDLCLQHRVEEEGDDGHKRVGTRHSRTRHYARAATFAQCALNAEYRHRPDGYGSGKPYGKTAQHNLYDCKQHICSTSVVATTLACEISKFATKLGKFLSLPCCCAYFLLGWQYKFFGRVILLVSRRYLH